MSTSPDNDLNLDQLFLPAWAQESPGANPYAKYEGRDESARGDRRGRDDRPRRRFEGRGREGQRGERGPKPFGPKGRGPRGNRDDRGRGRPERREPPPPLPELKVSLSPEEKGVELLARQIKMNGRAYPLFDIARMILQKPERHAATFEVIKKPDGTVAQELFVCELDQTLWLSEDEAIAHVMNRHFDTFYQTEKTPTEPPKGTYTFVAQCGMSGVILGPPNYHDYQKKLHRLHADRFSRLPFETFKSRVKIVRDEAVVKQWLEEQSWKTEFIALNVPEAVRFNNRAEVETHFRATHLANIIKRVESHRLSGLAARDLRGPLAMLHRQTIEDQRRFPLQIATVLSQQFASHGLQFFKVNKTITHVCVARPHFLDLETTPVSEGIKRIVAFINEKPKCTRRQLIEALQPAAAKSPPVEPQQPPSPVRDAGGNQSEQTPPQEAATGPTPAESQPQPEPDPAVTALITDLHWLIHQGHVIEFANGTLDTAKKPVPKPPKKEPAPKKTSPAEASSAGEAAAASAEPSVPASAAVAPAATESTITPVESVSSPDPAPSRESASSEAPKTGAESNPSEPLQAEQPPTDAKPRPDAEDAAAASPVPPEQRT